MSMPIWPWWKKADEPEAGTYRLMHFAGVRLEPEGEETPIAVFESMRGYLNEAVPISEMGKMMLPVNREDAMEDFHSASRTMDFPGTVGELANKLWSVTPAAVRESGLSRKKWYEREITNFINRNNPAEEKEDDV